MRTSLTFITITAAVLLAHPALAQGNDPFVGDWSGDCGESADCWITIEKGDQPNAYGVEFVVTSATNADDVKCRIKGTMTASGQDTLTGSLGASTSVRMTRSEEDGEPSLEVDGAADKPCGLQMGVNGSYGPAPNE